MKRRTWYVLIYYYWIDSEWVAKVTGEWPLKRCVCVYVDFDIAHIILENVPVANALQLEAARCHAVSLYALILSPVPSLKSIRCRLRAVLLLIRYVMLWPWTLTPWPWPLTPWPFVVLWASCVETLCKIWAKSNNPRQSYSRFSIFSAVKFLTGAQTPE